MSAPLPFVGADELRASTPVEPEWLWHGYLAPGALTILAGKPKAGKSTLAVAVSEAVARQAGPFLERAFFVNERVAQQQAARDRQHPRADPRRRLAEAVVGRAGRRVDRRGGARQRRVTRRGHVPILGVAPGRGRKGRRRGAGRDASSNSCGTRWGPARHR